MNNATFRLFMSLFSGILVLHAAAVFSQEPDPRLLSYPDSVLINGNVVSMDDTGVNENVGHTYEAVAIRDTRIMALGTTDSIKKLAGPHTTVYDLKGRTVIPGIIDTHAHVWDYAQAHWGPPIKTEYTIKADKGDKWSDIVKKTLDLLARVKDKLKPGEWILINWPRRVNGIERDVAIRNYKVMTAQMLDKANAKQRIVITGNRGVMNTPAVKTYGSFFDGNYPPEINPENGIVISATVHRMLFAEELYSMKEQIAMIGQEDREWTAYGITTWSSSIDSFKQLAAVLALDQEGRLAGRIAYGLGPTFYITMKHNPYLLYDFHGYGTDQVWFNAWSTTSNDGAYPLIATTIEARPEIKERELLRSRIQLTKDFSAKGLRFANVHVAGDRTLDITMDLLQAGYKEDGLSLDQIRAKRPAADHCDLNPRPEQIPRLKQMGMYMSCKATNIIGRSKDLIKDYGKKYLEWEAPMHSLIAGGVHTVYETDTHAIAGNGFFFYMDQFVNRCGSADNCDQVYAPDQRINRIWALKTATTWASYYLYKEHELGTLEQGKLADLLVLNKNYFDKREVPSLMIKTVRPLMTLVGGKVVFLDTSLASEFKTEPVGIEPEQVIAHIKMWEKGPGVASR